MLVEGGGWRQGDGLLETGKKKRQLITISFSSSCKLVRNSGLKISDELVLHATGVLITWWCSYTFLIKERTNQASLREPQKLRESVLLKIFITSPGLLS